MRSGLESISSEFTVKNTTPPSSKKKNNLYARLRTMDDFLVALFCCFYERSSKWLVFIRAGLFRGSNGAVVMLIAK